MTIHRDQLELLAVIVGIMGIAATMYYCRQIKETVSALCGILWELAMNRREQK